MVEKGVCSNSLWLYSISTKSWTCLLSGSQKEWSPSHTQLPPPRYAHQFVFDSVASCHYMFGGNLGNETAPKPQASMRLDDFWKLKVYIIILAVILKSCYGHSLYDYQWMIC